MKSLADIQLRKYSQVFFLQKKLILSYKKEILELVRIMTLKKRKNSKNFNSFIYYLLELKEQINDPQKTKRFGSGTQRELFTKIYDLTNEEEFVNACELVVSNVLGDFGGRSLWDFGKIVYKMSSFDVNDNNISDGEMEPPDVFYLIFQRIEELPNKVFVEGHLYQDFVFRSN